MEYIIVPMDRGHIPQIAAAGAGVLLHALEREHALGRAL